MRLFVRSSVTMYWLRKGWPRLPSMIRSVIMTGLSMGMTGGGEVF